MQAVNTWCARRQDFLESSIKALSGTVPMKKLIYGIVVTKTTAAAGQVMLKPCARLDLARLTGTGNPSRSVAAAVEL